MKNQIEFISDEAFFSLALAEDLGDGDVTSLSCLQEGLRGEAFIRCKEDGIISGVRHASSVFLLCHPDIKMQWHVQDGDSVRSGQVIVNLEGELRALLSAERLALNIMQRMSGIATQTHKAVQTIAGTGAIVLDTRKTTPLFRRFEKEAVRHGGGQNHRVGLFDMILIKDNHIDFCGSPELAISKALEYRKKHNPDLKIEIETRSLEDVQRVLALNAVDRIMFDNFSPERMHEAVQLVGKACETEASGGIHLNNILEYARTGVNYISLGMLTHSYKSLDLSMVCK